MPYLVVKPAYGRVLNSKKAVREYFNDGKDFQICSLHGCSGTYVSKSECDTDATLRLEIRYGKRGEKLIILPEACK